MLQTEQSGRVGVCDDRDPCKIFWTVAELVLGVGQRGFKDPCIRWVFGPQQKDALNGVKYPTPSRFRACRTQPTERSRGVSRWRCGLSLPVLQQLVILWCQCPWSDIDRIVYSTLRPSRVLVMLESEQADRAEAETGRLCEQTGGYLGGCLYPAGQHACTCHSISRSWRGPSEELILLMCQPARRREGGRLDAALSSIQNNDASRRSVITVAAAHRGALCNASTRPSVRPSVSLSVCHLSSPPFPLSSFSPSSSPAPLPSIPFFVPLPPVYSLSPCPPLAPIHFLLPFSPFSFFAPHHSDLLV